MRKAKASSFGFQSQANGLLDLEPLKRRLGYHTLARSIRLRFALLNGDDEIGRSGQQTVNLLRYLPTARANRTAPRLARRL